MNSKIEMASTHRLSLLFIILISGFKLGIAAPANGTKGTKIETKKETLDRKWSPQWLRELKVLLHRARDEKTFFFHSRQMLQLIKNRWEKYKLVKRRLQTLLQLCMKRDENLRWRNSRCCTGCGGALEWREADGCEFFVVTLKVVVQNAKKILASSFCERPLAA